MDPDYWNDNPFTDGPTPDPFAGFGGLGTTGKLFQSDTIFGTFEPNPKTKALNTVAVGQTFIDVDSAVSFPEFGEMVLIGMKYDLLCNLIITNRLGWEGD